MDKDKLKEEVVSQLRCCLVSVKGRCDLRQIQSDFRMLMGCGIPYSKLGYNTLEDFVRSIPSLTTTSLNGQLYVDAKPTEKSSHISSMIDRQRTTKKRAPSRRPHYRPRSRFNNRSNDAPRWRPNNLKKTYQSSPRPAAVSHNQFVNLGAPRPPPVSHNQFVNHATPQRAPHVPTVSKISNRLSVSNEPSRSENGQKDSRSKLASQSNNVQKDLRPNSASQSEIVQKDLRIKLNQYRAVDSNLDNASKVDKKLENGTDLTIKARMRLAKKMAEVLDNKENDVKEKNVIKNMKPSPLNNISLSQSMLLEESLSSSCKHAVKSNNIPISRISDLVEKQNPRQNYTTIIEEEVEQPDFTPTGEHLVDLESFATLRNLGDLNIIVKLRKVKRKSVYDCSIKVASLSFSSYPDEFDTQEAAKQFVAKLALEQLMVKFKKRKSLLISDDKDIKERIPPIVKSHFNGIWNTQLEADYIEMFNEHLPINWLEIVDLVDSIEVVPCLNKYVLRYCKPGEAFQKGYNGVALLVSNVSIPSNTVNFDSNNMLIAEVTCVASAGEIWCCQKETSEAEAFTDMCNRMETYYNLHSEQEIVEEIVIGGYYVVLNDGMWCRVRVFEISESGVHCFCIDFGDEWIVSKDTVYKLQRLFAREAAQAFVCRLAGIEELYEISKSTDCLSNLVGKIVQVQLETRSDNSGGSTPNDPALSVIFYDIENEDVINEYLINAISLESANPFLSLDTPTEVFVVHAEDDGSVYLQVHSTGYNQLMSWLSDLQQDILDGKIVYSNQSPTPEDSENRLYFVENKEDKIWYRTKINDWSPDAKFAQLLFVDFGKTTIVNVSETKLYPIDELSDIIHKFAHQAVTVQMALNNNVPKNFVQQISKLMLTNQAVLVRVVGHNECGVPLCDFFKRNETDNILFSINAAISIEDEFQNLSINEGNPSNGHSVKLQKLISLNQFDSLSKSVPSTGSLPSPPLPKPGDYFDVKVPCAVNPYNFFVQPYESQEKLSKLMAGLQESCKDITYSPLHVEDIQPGRIYASRHDDGKWYRTSVIKVIHAGSISVFYCDFGYYANLTLQQLVPLNIEFMSLPYQAMKAKLAGIEPKNSKWTMDDCKYFEKLVCRKSFVSILVSTETDDFYRYDIVLNLKLIDTATVVDVYIDQILVERSIAKYKDDQN